MPSPSYQQNKAHIYKWRLNNNYERAIFLKGDEVFAREATRYKWANKNLLGNDVFEYVLLNKRAEWDEYRKQVSAFELNRYLPVL